MPDTSSHPDDQQLKGWVQGTLPNALATGVLDHVSSCAQCSVRAEVLATNEGGEGGTQKVEIEPLAAESGLAAGAAPFTVAMGTRVGRYVVLEQLGKGGMGIVYAAYDPELHRKVAIKLLQVSGDGTGGSSGEQARLLREAQAMAQLSHPNVVSVYDVGLFEGRVFMAMELVEGQSVREWLEAGKRSWREVLRVFQLAARGLIAAHATDMVHRDLKPDNILVGKDGRVYVMDFGLARAVQQVPGEAPPAPESQATPTGELLSTPLTQVGRVLGTPSYMAPELFRGVHADARSDQFGYAVALYEALYGERPFGRHHWNDPARWQLREMPKATRVPAWVRDIVIKGLALETAARYSSMEALLRDLENDPWVRRRRYAVAAAGVLVVGALALISQRMAAERARLCSDAPTLLKGVWDEGQKKSLQAVFLNSGKPYAADAFLRTARVLDSYAGRWVSMRTATCEATKIRGDQSDEVMALSMGCLDRRLEGLRSLTAALAKPDAEVLAHAYDAAGALDGLEGCADVEGLRAPVALPQDPAARARIEAARHTVAQAKALGDTGRNAEGLALLEPVLPQAKALKYRPIEAEVLLALGQLHDTPATRGQAEQDDEQAVWAAEAGGHRDVALAASIELVKLTLDADRFEEAHAWVDHASGSLEHHPSSPRLEGRLALFTGELALKEGQAKAALEQDQKGLATLDKAGAAAGVAILLHSHLAQTRLALGEVQAALDEGQAAVAQATKTHGADHPQTGRAQLSLAGVLFRAGRADEAMRTGDQGAAVLDQSVGGGLQSLAELWMGLGAEQVRAGRFAEGIAALTHAQQVLAKASVPVGSHVEAELALSRAYLAQGDAAQALAAADRARALAQPLGEADPLMAFATSARASALEASGKAAEALPLHQKAVAALEKGDPLAFGSALEALGTLYLDKGDAQKALEQFDRALTAFKTKLGETSPRLVGSLSGAGRAHLALKSYDKAVAPLDQAVQSAEAARLSSGTLGELRLALGEALWEQGKEKERAYQLVHQSESDLTSAKRSPLVAQAHQWLAGHNPPPPAPAPAAPAAGSTPAPK